MDSAKMNFCPQCGSRLREGALFCEKCGARVGTQPPQLTPVVQPAQPPRPTAAGHNGIFDFFKDNPGNLLTIAGLIFAVVAFCVPFSRQIKRMEYMTEGAMGYIFIALAVIIIASLFIRTKIVRTAATGVFAIAGFIYLLAKPAGFHVEQTRFHGFYLLLSAAVLFLAAAVCYGLSLPKDRPARFLWERFLVRWTQILHKKGELLVVLGLIFFVMTIYFPFKRQFLWYGYDWTNICLISRADGVILLLLMILTFVFVLIQKNIPLFISTGLLELYGLICWILVITNMSDPDGENIKLHIGFFTMIAALVQVGTGLGLLIHRRIKENQRAEAPNEYGRY